MTAATVTALRNPYWDAVKDCVRTDYDGGPMADPYGRGSDRYGLPPQYSRHELVSRYSWTITDPVTVAFVAGHITGGLVDPMAGSGWWLWLLSQLGVDCIGYDANPPSHGGNTYHKVGIEHVDVLRADAVDAVTVHSDRTLLLSWPPYDDDIGARVLRAYAGRRVIYIGEGEGGCCGDDGMHRMLAAEWREVAEHRPVQHFGMHDWVTVYDRAGAS